MPTQRRSSRFMAIASRAIPFQTASVAGLFPVQVSEDALGACAVGMHEVDPDRNLRPE